MIGRRLVKAFTYKVRFVLFVIFSVASAICSAQQILVPPYLQPGNTPTLNAEQMVIIWQTDTLSSKYSVECKLEDDASGKTVPVKISSVSLDFNKQISELHRAVLTGLEFDKTYTYTVLRNNFKIGEGKFNTRTKKPQTRFAVFGDCGIGSPHQARVAYQIYQKGPQFVLLTGDMVYSFGREAEYRARFFPSYMAPIATPNRGAGLMKSVPFYMLLGNHDIYSANLSKFPDGLAYFYYNDLPLNAPIFKNSLKAEGSNQVIASFAKNTAPRFPVMANYSFDYGNVHITCIDGNYYIDPQDPALIDWITKDINSSNADWKIVAYHQPGFSSSPTHYDEQHMRLLSPLLEKLGVDLVLSGHVHNYQRTVPMKFQPKLNAKTNLYPISSTGRVNGTFTLDTSFDGQTRTRPEGIIYVVSGAGGAALYDNTISNNPKLWKTSSSDNWAPYTVKLISDVHSFTFIETNGKRLTLEQIDSEGNSIDKIVVTK